MSREQMIEALVRNELDWIAGGNADSEQIAYAADFFSKGGFTAWTDDKVKEAYENLTA